MTVRRYVDLQEAVVERLEKLAKEERRPLKQQMELILEKSVEVVESKTKK